MRHGAVAYFDEEGRPLPQDDVPLTEEGREQARAAAEALRGVPFDRCVTSGLRRTVETAEIVAGGRGLELEAWPELREIAPGRLADVPEEEIEQAFLHAWRGSVPRDARFLGGELVGDFLDRVHPALDRLLTEPWDHLLAVLHGGVNRALLSWAATGERVLLGPFEQAPACISVVDVGDDWVIRTVGWTPYDPLHGERRLTTMEELWEQFRGSA